MTENPTEPATDPLLARGGGNATAAGVNFQANLGALFACQMLAERPLDRRLGVAAQIVSLRFETEAPLDDILVETDSGWIFVQAKTNLSLATGVASELSKTAEQIVRQWLACVGGDARRRWDRPLQANHDRFLLAVGVNSPRTVSVDLARAISSVNAPGAAPLPHAAREALAAFSTALRRAWLGITGQAATEDALKSLLSLVRIIAFDFDGADRTSATETVTHLLRDPSQSPAVFSVVSQHCGELMKARLGADAPGLRRALTASGILLFAPPSYRRDVEQLLAHSERFRQQLQQYEETKVGDTLIHIDRPCAQAVVDAAIDGSILLVGDPGAGKSAVVNSAAEKIRAAGFDVVELAVDRLPVASLEGLAQQLNLANPVREVLANWPGDQPAFLFIDALDATRGGPSEAVFRSLIADTMSLPDTRWRVVASIRTFDLRLGEQFRELFRGSAPDSAFSDKEFSDVRHIHVPPWSTAELEELLTRAPQLETALNSGGERLRELALVPFNTRLLADLITGGLVPEEFGNVRRQVELLALYWRHRVNRHGAGAELCLKAAVADMIERRALRANRLETSRSDPTAFDQLLRENVLVTAGEQSVAFRHHILFDYATSRLFLDPDNLAATADLLSRPRGLSLMLAPAFAFALQHLWGDERNERRQFWDTVRGFAGDPACDPVARSVAARTASELPRVAHDTAGLVHGLSAPGDTGKGAATALSHVVGALVVRLEDKQPVVLAPWCNLAAEAAAHVKHVVWPLRTLLYALIEKAETGEQRSQLGLAARSLLRHALDSPHAPTQLAAAAIDFVATTYSTDLAASKELLRSIFQADRFRDRGDQEVPWLTRKMKPIADVDPDFVVEIYGHVFGADIHDNSPTSMGSSQILPLTSNRRQDYEMARWSLQEFFPGFLNQHPVHATRALIGAIGAHAATRHPIGDNGMALTLDVRGIRVRLRHDHSYVWAWNTEEEHGDNALSLLVGYLKGLRSAQPAAAIAIVHEVIANNELAVIWARTLLVAAERADVIGSLLWPIATQPPFLLSLDTQKDTIDFLAARYALESQEVRAEFERQALAFDFAVYKEPTEARRSVLETLFTRIEPDWIATPEAMQLHRLEPEGAARRSNRRPFEITTSGGAPAKYWWLEREGVDLRATGNATLLEHTDRTKAALGLDQANSPIDDVSVAVRLVTELSEAASNAPSDVTQSVAEASAGVAAQAATKLSRLAVKQLKEHPATLDSLVRSVLMLAAFPVDDPSPETEAKFETSAAWSGPSVRVEAAEAIMHLARCDAGLVERLRPTMERFLTDRDPAVRMQIAERLTSLWTTARPLMWQLAEAVAARETNRGVLRFFANYFLGRTIHAAPARVEHLVFALRDRAGDRTEEATQNILEEIGSIVAILWISHGRERARATLQEWLADPVTYENELGHAIGITRGTIVLKYQKNTNQNIEITRRAQELAAWAAESLASGLEVYLKSAAAASPTEAERDRGTLFAKLLNQVCNEFYFSSGAFRTHSADSDDPSLESDEARRAFLSDTYPILRRIADAGTPPTIHHLIELLEFLIPADPERVFDLVAHALLGAGHRHGYHFESLGADRFVAVIGRYLADYRNIFTDEGRRRDLVACLDAFMEAGWPAARRLLYRLPELLQ